MTEIMMALSNPYAPVSERLPGHVGSSLPGVEALIENGELLIRSESMFDRYLNKPEETEKSFLEVEGRKWFRTGDSAQINPDTGSYQILGRMSQDIIKRAGYKISALEIENVLLDNP